MQLSGKGKTAAVHNTGMVSVVTDNIVVLAYQLGDNTAVYGETSRETQCVILSDVFSQFPFQLNMDVKRSVQETAASATAAVLVHSLASGFYNTFVTRQTGICVRAKHQNMLAAHFYFCSLFSFYFAKIGVYTFFLNLLRKRIKRVLSEFFL